MPKIPQAPLGIPAESARRWTENYRLATQDSGRLFLMAGDQKVEHLNDDFIGGRVATDDADPEHLFRIASEAPVGCFAAQMGSCVARVHGRVVALQGVAGGGYQRVQGGCQTRLAAELHAGQIRGGGMHLDGEADGVDQFAGGGAAEHLTAEHLQGIGGEDDPAVNLRGIGHGGGVVIGQARFAAQMGKPSCSAWC